MNRLLAIAWSLSLLGIVVWAQVGSQPASPPAPEPIWPPRPLLTHPWGTTLPAEWADWRERFAPGDLDFDGMITAVDLRLCRWCAVNSGPAMPLDPSCYDATTQPAERYVRHCEVADLDGDGDVDLTDYGILQRAAGRRVPTSQPANLRRPVAGTQPAP